MWRYDTKCKYMFMFSLKKLACKGFLDISSNDILTSRAYSSRHRMTVDKLCCILRKLAFSLFVIIYSILGRRNYYVNTNRFFIQSSLLILTGNKAPEQCSKSGKTSCRQIWRDREDQRYMFKDCSNILKIASSLSRPPRPRRQSNSRNGKLTLYVHA